MTKRRQELLNKLKDKTKFLTKEEAEELGPVTTRELAPLSGDSFIDSLTSKENINEE